LDQVQGAIAVANGKYRLLEGTVLDFSEEIRQFGARGQDKFRKLRFRSSRLSVKDRIAILGRLVVAR
jgi:hypothetical protein